MKIVHRLEELEAVVEKREVKPIRQTISSYIDLMKPHVTVLLLGTTVAAMAIANQGLPPLGLVLATLLGGAMAAGSANCINCYIDRDIDQIMGRTQRRSLPSGRVEPQQALVFGIFLGIGSFIVLALFVNLLSAVLACSAILFYVFVYTLWLKRSTVQNIVIGGAAGAVPVLVGWAAVTGSLDLSAWLLFAIVFFWTPAHFWALALLISDDYKRAGVPMLPVVRGDEATAWNILAYAASLLPLTLLLFIIGGLGYVYLAVAIVLGALFIAYAFRLLRSGAAGRRAMARTVYLYSLLYLALLFVAIMVDSTLRL